MRHDSHQIIMQTLIAVPNVSAQFTSYPDYSRDWAVNVPHDLLALFWSASGWWFGTLFAFVNLCCGTVVFEQDGEGCMQIIS